MNTTATPAIAESNAEQTADIICRFVFLDFGGLTAVEALIFSASALSFRSSVSLEDERTKNMIFSKYGESVFVISSICLLTPLSIAIFLSCKKSMFEIIQIVFENFFVFIQKQEN